MDRIFLKELKDKKRACGFGFYFSGKNEKQYIIIMKRIKLAVSQLLYFI